MLLPIAWQFGSGSHRVPTLWVVHCRTDTLALHSSGKLKTMLDDIGVAAKFD